MATTLEINWDAITNFSTLTNLDSLASGNMWVSGKVESDPSAAFLEISYTLVCDGSVAAEDVVKLFLARGNDDSTEIRDGGISDSEQEISTANALADLRDALGVPIATHRIDRASQTLNKVFRVENPGPDWRLVIDFEDVSGGLASSGNVVSYRHGNWEQVTP